MDLIIRVNQRCVYNLLDALEITIASPASTLAEVFLACNYPIKKGLSGMSETGTKSHKLSYIPYCVDWLESESSDSASSSPACVWSVLLSVCSTCLACTMCTGPAFILPAMREEPMDEAGVPLEEEAPRLLAAPVEEGPLSTSSLPATDIM